ncbi:uncharacterized protein LOC130893694 [Diorhabda carinulata]|uniref:uncharacterized protein LOC130893694 n=1 Tax=Diorhabda carinulata TaxID=1163345 RepID=UPI0025A07CCA|nr:uncharacterized protein LOC130893694 [Diorhabda carinulata]XP_057655985.1 uncharacterized protein LOC130893694 [Diorhabda carinulata]
MSSEMVCLLFLLTTFSLSQGACQFKKSWQGRWFQSGVPNYLFINSTYIETKGDCYEEQGDKYLVYDRTDDCYRCMVIHPKHPSVLQYKETYCESKASLVEICQMITGDAPLYSLFRKNPEAKPIACPFKSAPFTFSYNRMTGDCSNPPSKAESCTDDSRLVLKYQACPDVPSTESNVEELVCLATWKEGSTRYLIGKLSQPNRRSASDEDQYRCFIYKRSMENGKTIYSVAQSGDATCTGLDATAFEGSRTMMLTTVDDQHKRCKFPVWITEHHTWLSLDHQKTYKFSQRNATLKILDDDPPKMNKVQPNFPQAFAFEEFGMQSQEQRKQNSEMRVVCHAILQQQEQKKVQIVAHITAGCDSGYVCMLFYKRDSNVIELQQTEKYVENPDEACSNFDPGTSPYTTLITTTLHSKKCPHLGRYTIASFPAQSGKRKRRQEPEKKNTAENQEPDCISDDFETLSVGCSGTHEMEFKSTCSQQAISYTCHGNWEENGVSYVIATSLSKKFPEAKYCFMYKQDQMNSAIIEGNLGKGLGPPILRMSRVTESCHRNIDPGISGNWAFNFTSNGTCQQSDHTNSSQLLVPMILLVIISLALVVVIR